MRSLAFVIIAVSWTLQLQPARAADARVWSGLVLATNSPNPHDPPEELAPVLPKLKSVFGYNQFDIIGSHEEEMNKSSEQWLIPTKSFYLHVRSEQRVQADYVVHLQFYHEKRLLVETSTKLSRHNPLFIRGPLYGQGQLIIVLLVK
jgi:hypothetical protein